MTFWDLFFILIIFIPFTITWIFTAVDIFQRPDTSGLGKFGWLVLILALPLFGMLIYYMARPSDAQLVSSLAT
jgi:hypothetical protein